MIKKDFHVHTTYCDGKSAPEEIVLAAIDSGLDFLGFSGHSYTFFDESWCMSQEGSEAYKKEISGLKAKYADKIKILCGTEQDFYSDYSTHGYDYFIGSVHYLRILADGRSAAEGCISDGGYIYMPVDETAAIQKAAADKYFGGDIYSFAEKYFETVGLWADRTPLPDFIGHFDLISKFNEKERLYDENNPRYIAAWKKAADKLLAKGLVFEINTGAIARGYRTSPYPAPDIQDYIIKKGGRFIMSSDSHYKDTLLYKFEEFQNENLIELF